ncbi:hypothetical protein Misp02_67680 [Microtetraspora sp. NBRC 16547]|nr:hypothetical protein Misp02_67680 [Microtetraspora sp. NBRC 16547]
MAATRNETTRDRDLGNRTRAVSLGIAWIKARTDADLRVEPVMSDRGCPLVTLPNGTPMAR